MQINTSTTQIQINWWLNLSIRHQENGSNILDSSLVVQNSDVSLQVHNRVALAKCNLEYFETTNEGSQPWQTLFTAATNTDQERVATRRLKNAIDSQNMGYSILHTENTERLIEIFIDKTMQVIKDGVNLA